MGRSLYTPSTLAYLSHGGSVGSSRSSSPSGSSSLADSGTLSVGHEEIKYGQEQETETRRSRLGRTSKDAPTSWAERSFDPDDENLPVVTERFLVPGESRALTAVFGPASDDDEDSQDEDSEEDASDYGSEDGNEEEEGDHVLVETVEIERIIEEAERDAAVDMDEENSNQEEDDEEMPHGNGGYYDYPVQDRRSISDIAADSAFSPSSAVFHAHTLPFSLPSTDAMQLQRRSSGNSASSRSRAV